MMHDPQNINDINVNGADCCWRHLYPLSILFEYVFVCVCVQELLQVVFCAHRSITQVNIVKVLVPFFRERDMLHAGSYFSTYCKAPASHRATGIASRLVLRLRAARYGLVATFHTS